MEELRTYWQIPGITHFFNLFANALKLPSFDVEDLELAFTTPIPEAHCDIASDQSSNRHSVHLVVNLFIHLLRGYFGNTLINRLNWDKYLYKLLEIQLVQREGKSNPLEKVATTGDDDCINFDSLSLKDKVEILHLVCEYRLYPDAASDSIYYLEPQSLRLEPLGEDNKGNTYWYFGGTRLYRENLDAAKVVSSTLQLIEKWKKKQPAIKKGKSSPTKETQVNSTQESLTEAPTRKKAKREIIPGERISTRASKPVDRLNGEVLWKSQSPTKKTATTPPSKSKKLKEKPPEPEFEPDPATTTGVPLDQSKAAWDCICVTLEDWQNLIDSFSRSKITCEVSLRHRLQDLILDVEQKFISLEKLKAKELKQKLLELVPRRASSRIEIKKIQEEEDKKREVELREQQRREATAAENRRRAEENRKKQEEIRLKREERAQQRLALMEERAARVAMREQNALLNSASNSITDSNESREEDGTFDATALIPVTNGWPGTSAPSSSSAVKSDLTEFHDKLGKIMSSVWANRDAWPFKEPVDEEKVPNYYQVIENPIDLSVIQSKIADKVYTDLIQVESDFKLMVNNCETFNGPKNGYTSMAHATWKVFKRSVKRYLNQDLSEDESSVFLYPPRQPPGHVISAAIEAKKRKAAAKKHRKGMKALEVLERVAEITVRDTQSSRSSSRASSVLSPASFAAEEEVITNANDFMILDDITQSTTDDEGSSDGNGNVNSHAAKRTRLTGPMNSDTFINFLHKASNASDMTAFYVESGDNLTFKSLTEWSESIKNSDKRIILPQDAVVICAAPDETVKAENQQRILTLKVVETNATDQKTPPGRLVVKLSRCASSSDGRTWRPVQIINSHPGASTEANDLMMSAAVKRSLEPFAEENSDHDDELNDNVQKNDGDNDYNMHDASNLNISESNLEQLGHHSYARIDSLANTSDSSNNNGQIIPNHSSVNDNFINHNSLPNNL